MEAVVVVLIIVALIALILSVFQIGRLTILSIRQPGIGRILFLSMASLKAWAATFLFLVLLNYFDPQLIGATGRLWFNLGLAVYLCLQPIVVNVAVWRWEHPKKEKDHA